MVIRQRIGWEIGDGRFMVGIGARLENSMQSKNYRYTKGPFIPHIIANSLLTFSLSSTSTFFYKKHTGE